MESLPGKLMLAFLWLMDKCLTQVAVNPSALVCRDHITGLGFLTEVLLSRFGGAT